jgi:hypothetical protein
MLASEHAGPPAGRHEPRVEPVVANRQSQRRRRMTLRLLDPHSTQQTLWESNPPHCPPQVADQRICSHHRVMTDFDRDLTTARLLAAVREGLSDELCKGVI